MKKSSFALLAPLKATLILALMFLQVMATANAETVQSVSQMTYDADGRLQCMAIRMKQSTFTSLPSSACSLATVSSDPEQDRITKNVYDDAGQLIQVRRAVGTAIEQAEATYSYTDNGKRQQVVDGNGNRAQLVYDGFDRQTQWIFPSQTRPSGYNAAAGSATILALSGTPGAAGALNTSDYEQYGYDPNGNRTSLRKRDGSTLTYQYDALNRMTVKVVPERSGLSSTHTRDVYYTYDLRGLMTAARFDSASGEGITTAYDGFGRINSTTQVIDGASRTLSYLYDADGNRTRVTFPDGNYATYAYDGLDRPLTIQRSGTVGIASYTYDSAGRRTGFNGGITTGYSYDAAGRLGSLSNTVSNSAYNLTISGACLDIFGNPSVCYNLASQITQIRKSNDAFVFTGTYNVDRPYTANGLNQYTVAGTASFGYDLNGNLTSEGSALTGSVSTTFVYDSEDRLVSANGAKNATLRYDPMGRLYEVIGSSGITRFLNDGDAMVAEYDSGGNLLRRYIHGADIAADDPIAWYEGASFDSASERLMRPDWQGSIVLVTDPTAGNVIAVNRYDEYGIPQLGNVGRFQYTGQAWLPDLGVSYYKARMYSPTLGRFMQTDPIGYKDQINLYAYVANDPIDKTDFSGLAGENGWLPEHFVEIAVEGAEAVEVGTAATASAVVVAVGVALWPTPAGESPEALERLRQSKQPAQQGAQTARVNPDGKTFTDSTGRVRTPSTGGPGAGNRITPGQRTAERTASGNRCIYCGNPTTNTPGRPNSSQGDHIAPRNPREGGPRGNNSPENVGNGCATCNRQKSNWNPIDWIKRTFGY